LEEIVKVRICRVYLETEPGSPYGPTGQPFSGTTQLGRGRVVDCTRLENRGYDDNGTDVGEDGIVRVRAAALRACIASAGYRLSGRRRRAAQRFAAGFFCNGDMPLSADGKPLRAEDATIVTMVLVGLGGCVFRSADR
jgi:hypothetical protein